MSLPVIEQIAEAIVARLETVTEGNEYHQTICGVTRPTKSGNYTPSPWLIVLRQDNAELSLEHSYPGNPGATAWVQSFLITLWVRPRDKDTTPVDRIVNLFRSDVEKAVTTPANWDTWGGLAIMSQWSSATPFEFEDSYEGIQLKLDVTYRVRENDPYTVA